MRAYQAQKAGITDSSADDVQLFVPRTVELSGVPELPTSSDVNFDIEKKPKTKPKKKSTKQRRLEKSKYYSICLSQTKS